MAVCTPISTLSPPKRCGRIDMMFPFLGNLSKGMRKEKAKKDGKTREQRSRMNRQAKKTGKTEQAEKQKKWKHEVKEAGKAENTEAEKQINWKK